MTLRAHNVSMAAIAVMLALANASAATPAHAAPGGDLATLHNGRWTCEYPGDAAAVPRQVPGEGFRITPDSSYRTTDGKGGGTYLLLGKAMVFTSGPLNGHSYEAQSANTVLQLDAQGKRTGVRCSRKSAASGGFADAPEATVNGAN